MPSRAALGYLARTYRDHRTALVAAVGAGLGWRVCGLLLPLAVGRAVEHGVAGGERRLLDRWVLAIIVLAFGASVLAMVRHRNAAVSAARSAVVGRRAVLRTIHAAVGPRRTRFAPGELVARATSDVDRVRQLVDFSATTVVSTAIVVAIIVAMAVTDVWLATVVAVPVTTALVVLWRRSSRAEQRSTALQSLVGNASVVAEASATKFRAVSGLGATAALESRWHEIVRRLHARGLAVAKLEARYEPAVELASALTMVAALWLAGHGAIDGRITLATAIAVFGWCRYLGDPMQMIGQGMVLMRRGRASAARLAEVHTAPADEVPPDEDGVVVVPPSGRPLAIELRDVTVERGGRRVLDCCTIEIAAGESVALVSRTGGGKSTTAALLGRQLESTSGAVLVGGADVRRWAPADLHRAVRVVGRDEFVFGGTIRHNVAFGRPEAETHEVMAALDRAGARDVVDAKGGLDGSVGTVGRALSGGQRQRLALARALLDPPGVLVLDEATAAVDPRREDEILAAARTSGVTLVLLTSRASVAMHADRVVLLEHGRVVATGRHDELLERSAHYGDLVDERVELEA